jgi:hypothetical protein
VVAPTTSQDDRWRLSVSGSWELRLGELKVERSALGLGVGVQNELVIVQVAVFLPLSLSQHVPSHPIYAPVQYT